MSKKFDDTNTLKAQNTKKHKTTKQFYKNSKESNNKLVSKQNQINTANKNVKLLKKHENKEEKKNLLSTNKNVNLLKKKQKNKLCNNTKNIKTFVKKKLTKYETSIIEATKIRTKKIKIEKKNQLKEKKRCKIFYARQNAKNHYKEFFKILFNNPNKQLFLSNNFDLYYPNLIDNK